MLDQKTKNVIYALATLIGTIVGGGIFGLPYVFSKSGFVVGLLFLIVFGLITTLIHLMYGEVVLATKEKHRLIGFTTTYLGKRFGHWSAWLILFGLYGSSLAYIILGGKFLHILFGFMGLGEVMFSVLFFALGAFIVLFGIRSISKTEVAMSFFLFGIVLFLFIKSIPHIEMAHLQTIDGSAFFFSYGVILFAFAGAAAIPEISEILGTHKEKLRQVITLGTLIPLVLYIVFVVSVLGVAGSAVSQEAIQGLVPFLGEGIVRVGALFGFFAVFTSFLVIGVNLRDVFLYDYRLPKLFSWVLALFPALLLFLFGIQQFIGVVSFVGAIIGGFTGIVIIEVHRRSKTMQTAKPAYVINLPLWARNLLIGIFVLGILYQIATLFI